MKTKCRAREEGYVLLVTLFLLALGMLVSAAMLDSAGTNVKTRALVKTRADYYYNVEATLNKTVAWLQGHSKYLVTAFMGSNFENNFDTGAPTLGENEGEHFGVATLVKMKNTNNTVMLSNNDFFGVAAFPNTTHIDTNEAFNPVQEFANADLGEANARVVLVWARPTDGNYEPVFRIDVVTGNNPDRGVHSYSYVYSQLEADTASSGSGDGIGFFAQNGVLSTKTGNNECYSYLWTYASGVWSKGAPRNNCVVAGNHAVTLKSMIHGNALTNQSDGVTLQHPTGAVSGTICEAAGCHSHSISPFDTWEVTCAGASQGSLTISGDQTLTSGPNLADQCWDTVEVLSNATLRLTDTENPYRFRRLYMRNNSNSVMRFPTLQPDQKITIYVNYFEGGILNGNQLYNVNNAPRNLEINITGNMNFKLNGTADMHAHFIAPLSTVEHEGTFVFHGAIEASEFKVTGNGSFSYDEGIGAASSPALTDIAFTLRKASQRYR